MKKVTNFAEKVNEQVKETVLDKASWVIGIDIGKENLSCALMDISKTLVCVLKQKALLMDTRTYWIA